MIYGLGLAVEGLRFGVQVLVPGSSFRLYGVWCMANGVKVRNR